MGILFFFFRKIKQLSFVKNSFSEEILINWSFNCLNHKYYGANTPQTSLRRRNWQWLSSGETSDHPPRKQMQQHTGPLYIRPLNMPPQPGLPTQKMTYTRLKWSTYMPYLTLWDKISQNLARLYLTLCLTAGREGTTPDTDKSKPHPQCTASFFRRMVVLWNRLPEATVSQSTLEAFQNQLAKCTC